ncbi:Lipid A export ATP-binding/permease protein MsbA [Actinokineospora spheciospongiae]|uniref:Lipid A export ATP-binding/permease protein MsbA n=1 Tax=Actinokineospora spheciospongiae TaxID=909613 RepID=W7IGE4_9PSEU|nr:ABC transporter ATP-binding protein [Actinokineospora spheciospongiae]EWC59368.1 Lipid A export ATP-binding/permease protein MsbA [Actinokineospora spheciospongiae]
MLLRLLRTALRPYRGAVALVVALQVVQTVAFLLLPTLNALIIDRGLLAGSVPTIWRLGGLMVVVAAVQLAARLGAQYFGARTAAAVGRDLRSAVYRRVQRFSAHEIGRFGTSSLSTRTLNDVQQVQAVTADGLNSIVAAPIMCVMSVVLALQQDVPLALVLVVLVPATAVVVVLLLARMTSLYSRIQVGVDRMNRLLREQVTGVRVVRAFVRHEHERQRFAEANTETFLLTRRARRLAAAVFPLVLLMGNGTTVLVVWIGAGRIGSGELRLGALSAFIGYVVLVLTAMVIAIHVTLTVPRARAAARRVSQVLDTRPELTRPADPPVGQPRRGHLDLRGVGFRYPGAEAAFLRDIDLTARPGRTLAVIGGTGSGKTTLLNLVVRAFDATTGTVLVGGVDVRHLTDEARSRAVGLVPQQPYLFAGTVESNLRWGDDDATEAELWHALEVAQARDFVAAMPGGLRAGITQGGTNVSGGQRQRLALARALVRRPGVYLFDDCFSGLDYGTEARLRAALAPEVADAAVVVVAQRVSTIRDADEIVVLEEGRVVGRGTHGELVAGNRTYQEIVRSQLTRQEEVA